MLWNRFMLFCVAAFSPSDVNECHDESLCTNGQCVNTEGSFYCNCNHPWTPDSNKKKCVMATIAGVWNSLSWCIIAYTALMWVLEEIFWVLSKLSILQIRTSVRTLPTVRMATVWTRRGRTTASALRPGPWPPTVTVVWLLRSRLVSADTLQHGE